MESMEHDDDLGCYLSIETAAVSELSDQLLTTIMSSLRNHRVIIASLFLPTTAVLGESSPPTPDIYAREVGTTAATQDLGGRPPAFRHASSRSIGSTPAPLKSIVDDLKVSSLI